MSLAFGLLTLRRKQGALHGSSLTPEELEVQRLRATLARFADRAWVVEAAPRTRLRQLEEVVLRASLTLKGMSPRDVWNEGDDAWSSVRRAICPIYMPDEPTYDQVEEGRRALATMLGHDSSDPQRP